MSDSAPKSYEGSVTKLQAMRTEVFEALELEETKRNSATFDFCVHIVAFEGTNVSIGRLKRLITEHLSQPDFHPEDIDTTGDDS